MLKYKSWELSDAALADAQRVETSIRTRCDCAVNAGYILLCAYFATAEQDHPNEGTAMSGGAELNLSIQDRAFAMKYSRNYFYAGIKDEEDMQAVFAWAERVRQAARDTER